MANYPKARPDEGYIDRQELMKERLRKERERQERVSAKYGISKERMEELRKQAQGNPFADHVSYHSAWQQRG